MEIKMNHVSKTYDKKVLDQVSLSISGYKTIGIIGKSGCGKSTLLKLMAGIEPASQGQITINGLDVSKEKRTYQDQISMVFQDHNLFPHLSLEENISLILEKVKGKNKTEAQTRAREELSHLHLEDQVDKKPDHVSGGQAQRASIARALATDPDIIFMDEPTAALDPLLSKEVLQAVLALKSSGKAFVFVTHELDFLQGFADYVIFMDQGQVVEQGPVAILKAPQSDQLQEFLFKERSIYDH